MNGVGAYCGLWWGKNHLNILGIDGRIILSGSARNGWSLDWDDLSLEGDLCQARVKTAVNHYLHEMCGIA